MPAGAPREVSLPLAWAGGEKSQGLPGQGGHRDQDAPGGHLSGGAACHGKGADPARSIPAAPPVPRAGSRTGGSCLCAHSQRRLVVWHPQTCVHLGSNRSPERPGHQAGKMCCLGLFGLGAAVSTGESCMSVAVLLLHAIPLGPARCLGERNLGQRKNSLSEY